MKEKIDNFYSSYELESASHSDGSSAGEETGKEPTMLKFEHDTNKFDNKLPSIKLKIYKNGIYKSVLTTNNTHDDISTNINSEKIHKDQEENDEVETSGIYDTTDTSDESDEENTFKIEKPNKHEDDSRSSLKFRISAKHIPETGATIYEMISVENSCNANDMKLTTDPENDSLNELKADELSFNGKINSIIINDKNVDENAKNNQLENNETALIDNGSNVIVQEVIKDIDLEVKKVDELTENCEKNDIKNNNITVWDNTKLLAETLLNQDNLQQKYLNEASPELFDEDSGDEDDDDDDDENYDNKTINLTKVDLNDNSIAINSCDFIHEKDKELLKKVRHSLSGLPPPTSLTIPQIDMFNTVISKKDDIFDFMNSIKNWKTTENDDKIENLFKPSIHLDEVKVTNWPNILNYSCHGIFYNNSKITEEIERLNLSVIDRYIGAETNSSYKLSPSSAKKRNIRLKQIQQSPGNRLSHLAKRRAVFSCANLQSKLQSFENNNRQILLDTKKLNNRKKVTPKRKTPNSRNKIFIKLPTSSGKKKVLPMRLLGSQPIVVPTRETSKRALFQSPEQQQQQKPILKPIFKPEIATRVERSKRALFSPEKNDFTSSQPNLYQKYNQICSKFGSVENLAKRKRSLDDESLSNNRSAKMFRADSDNLLTGENLTPRTLKFKSQSFSSSNRENLNDELNNSKSFLRANSDPTVCANLLSDSHKKKLLWAVSSALKRKQIGSAHVDFKRYAAVLFKAVKRIFLEYYKKATSTSETMLKLSTKYVNFVKEGKSVDDIYLLEKNFKDCEKMAAPLKLHGYIGPEEYANMKNYPLKKTSSCAFLSESSSSISQKFSSISQYSDLNKFSQDSLLSSSISSINSLSQQFDPSAMNNKLTIQQNKSLQNSSSKNNLTCLALRENNLDCTEMRKSGQKNFTGKDQRNVSPYLDKIKLQSTNMLKQSVSLYDLNTIKAKRQLFEC